MTPRSALSERVSMATAGVGIGPSRNTSMPTAVKPDIRAGLDHVAGEPRVLADHHPVRASAAVGEQLAGRHADAQRHLRGHRRPVGEAADAVGAEVLARHGVASLGWCLGWLRQDAAFGSGKQSRTLHLAASARRPVSKSMSEGYRPEAASQTASAWRVAATSCTRRICTPWAAPRRAAASEPGSL